jgi:hypothetical protein
VRRLQIRYARNFDLPNRSPRLAVYNTALNAFEIALQSGCARWNPGIREAKLERQVTPGLRVLLFAKADGGSSSPNAWFSTKNFESILLGLVTPTGVIFALYDPFVGKAKPEDWH